MNEIVMIVEKIYMTTVYFYENQSTLIYVILYTYIMYIRDEKCWKKKNVDGKTMKLKKMNELI